MKVISAYTTDPIYSKLAQQFKENCQKYQIDYSIYPYLSKGTWARNTKEKPRIILSALKEHRQPLVWVDIDCKFNSYPIFIEPKIIGLCIPDKTALWSSVMTFSYNDKTLCLLEDWIKACDSVDNGNPDDQIFDIHKELWENKYGKFDVIDSKFYKFDLRHKVENPTIEQIRASRHVLRNHKIRILEDGTLCAVRENSEVIKFMDKHYERVGHLRWRPYMKSIDIFRDIHKNKTANIIGKGPSLDKISYLNGPTFCVNDSIFKIEEMMDYHSHVIPLYCVLQDSNALRGKLPRKALIFSSQNAYPIYCNMENAYCFNFSEFTFRTITALVAIRLAKFMGCIGIKLYAFDAFDKITDYAPSLGYSPNQVGTPLRFLSHPESIEKYLKDQDLTYQLVRSEGADIFDSIQQ